MQMITASLGRHGSPLSAIDEFNTFEQGLRLEIQLYLRSVVKRASSWKEVVVAAGPSVKGKSFANLTIRH